MPDTPDPDPESNWTAARRASGGCLYCENDRDLERRGDHWFCPVCARSWLAYTRQDRAILRVNKIRP